LSNVTVPHLVGLRGATAAVKLEALGLRTFANENGIEDVSGSSSSRSSSTLTVAVRFPPPGFVVSQSPSAGVTVQRGSTVRIAVASQP